ncbi:MAG: hypothetical protein K9I02_07575 [Haliscomenobacter sp.]|nr:hypothetical protein [Haliscomenobacter sp.]
MSDFIRQHTNTVEGFSKENSWVILSELEARIKTKIETVGRPLKDWDVQINYGIKTGFNEAFIIDSIQRNELLKNCPKADAIIRPILRGRDIGRYKINYENLWLINSHNGIKEQNLTKISLEKDYPGIYQYLLKYEKQLSNRSDKGDHWSNLRNCAYLDIFSGPKILYAETMRLHKGDLSNFPRFTFDKGDFICDKTVFAITGQKLKYILGFLNSRISGFLLPKYVPAWDDGGFMLQKVFLESVPIPTISDEFEEHIIKLVENIISGENMDNNMEQINTAFYNSINFIDEEIEMIEQYYQLYHK